MAGDVVAFAWPDATLTWQSSIRFLCYEFSSFRLLTLGRTGIACGRWNQD